MATRLTGVVALDQATTSFGAGTSVTTLTLTPSQSTTIALFLIASGATSIAPDAGWSTFDNPAFNYLFGQQLVGSSSVFGHATLFPSDPWAAMLVLYSYVGSTLPTYVQKTAFPMTSFAPTIQSFTNANRAGNKIWVLAFNNGGSTRCTGSVLDTNGNSYALISSAYTTDGNRFILFYEADNVKAGPNMVTFTPDPGMNFEATQILLYEVTTGGLSH